MRRNGLAVILAVCGALLAVGLLAFGWALVPTSSEAQSDTMHNCPPAGKWSIAVWEGQDATAAADALGVCGTGAVAAAYSLDSQTGAWSRWFAGKPDVSNLTTLNEMQGILALGAAGGSATTPTPVATGTAGLPELGTWRGTTSQGKPIEFDVVEGSPGSRAIGRIQFDFVGTSSEGKSCSGSRGEGHTSIAIANNEFSLDRMEYGDFEISGRFDSATTASGDLEYSGFALPPDYDPCHAGHMTWTASLQ